MKNIPSTHSSELQIRVAEMTDLPAIIAIYNQAVPARRSTANTIPWTIDSRTPWFNEHEPAYHPIYVAEIEDKVVGWCSLSTYRPGRLALRFTSEISYYIDINYQRQGIGSALIGYALSMCPSLRIKNVIAVIIDRNEASKKTLEKLGFQQWAYLPRVLDFDGEEYGEFYYGKRVAD